MHARASRQTSGVPERLFFGAATAFASFVPGVLLVIGPTSTVAR
jgi:hypothetical protein